MRVPTMDAQNVAPQAMPTPFNSNRTSPEDFGAGVAQSINQGANVAAGLIKEHRERVTADRASDAQVQLGNAINDANWNPASELDAQGNPTGEPKGYLLKLGKNGVDPAKHLQGLDDVRDNITNSLADNPEAQRLFRMRAAGMLEGARQQAEQHSGQQIQRVGLETAEAQKKLAIDTIGLAHGTPDEVKTATDRAVQFAVGPLVHHLQFNEGRPQEAVNAALTDFKSQAYGKALQTFIDARDGMGARQLYEKTKGELGAMAPEYEKLVIKAEHQQRGGVIAGEAVKDATGAGGWVDLKKALQYIDDRIGDDDERKESALREVESRAALYNKAAADTEKQTLGRVWMDIEHHGGSLNENSADFQSLSDEAKGRAIEKSRGILRQFKADSRSAAADARREAAEARAEQSRADRSAIDAFGGMAADPHAQVDLDPEKHFPGASPDAINAIKKIQAGIAKKLNAGEGVKAGEFASVVNKQIAPLLNDKDDRAAFMGLMQRWYLDPEQHSGKEPTKEEVLSKIADELQLEKGRFWGTGARKFQRELSGEEMRAPAAPEKQDYVPNRAPAKTPQKASSEPGKTPQKVSSDTGKTAQPGPDWKPRTKKDGTAVWWNPATGEARPR